MRETILAATLAAALAAWPAAASEGSPGAPGVAAAYAKWKGDNGRHLGWVRGRHRGWAGHDRRRAPRRSG